MNAIDTNILVRFLVNDDEKQGKAVRLLFEQAEEDGKEFYVVSNVLLETIWVLTAAYECPRSAVLDAIETLSEMAVLRFQDIDYIHQFLDSARSSTFNLSDLLIGYSARSQKCKSTITFDKKAAKSNLFVILSK